MRAVAFVLACLSCARTAKADSAAIEHDHLYGKAVAKFVHSPELARAPVKHANVGSPAMPLPSGVPVIVDFLKMPLSSHVTHVPSAGGQAGPVSGTVVAGAAIWEKLPGMGFAPTQSEVEPERLKTDLHMKLDHVHSQTEKMNSKFPQDVGEVESPFGMIKLGFGVAGIGISAVLLYSIIQKLFLKSPNDNQRRRVVPVASTLDGAELQQSVNTEGNVPLKDDGIFMKRFDPNGQGMLTRLHPLAPPRFTSPVMDYIATNESKRQLVQIAPPKALALLKMWQSQSADRLVSIGPDPKNPEKLMVDPATARSRRAKWSPHATFFATATTGIMKADAGDYPQAQRELIDCLQIAGCPRGPGATVYASLGGGTSILCLVEISQKYYSVLALVANPSEKQDGNIIEAEATTLSALYGEAVEVGAMLRVHSACEAALVGSRRCLGLMRPAVGMEGHGGTTWSMCGPEGAYDMCELDPVADGAEDEGCLIALYALKI